MSEVRFMKQNAQIQLTQPSPLSGRCRVVRLAEAFCGGMLRSDRSLIKTVGRAGVHDPLADIGIIVPAPVYIHIDSVILLTKPFSHVIIISKLG